MPWSVRRPVSDLDTIARSSRSFDHLTMVCRSSSARNERVSRPRTARSRGGVIAALVAAALMVSGCGMLSDGIYNAPLPGGADIGSDPLELTADFDDVLDLVPQSSVKVDDIAVGRVHRIGLNDDGESARVRLLVNADVDLPAGTTARIQQTSLLGEKYVALIRPETPQAGPDLASGDHVSLNETSQAVGVEPVLGALSLLLNGGGVGQFQEISQELQAISDERPEEITEFLRQMRSFTSDLDDRSESVVNAIDGLAELSRTLNEQSDSIENALENLSPGLEQLVDQHDDFMEMIVALDDLGEVAVRTLDAAQEDIIADLEMLAPTLRELAAAGHHLPHALEILLTYPFPDSVLPAIQGDYLNTFITTNFRTPGGHWPQASAAWPASGGGEAGTQSAPRTEELPEPPTTLPESGSEASPGPMEAPPTMLPPTRAPGTGDEPGVVVPSPWPSEEPPDGGQ